MKSLLSIKESNRTWKIKISHAEAGSQSIILISSLRYVANALFCFFSYFEIDLKMNLINHLSDIHYRKFISIFKCLRIHASILYLRNHKKLHLFLLNDETKMASLMCLVMLIAFSSIAINSEKSS